MTTANLNISLNLNQILSIISQLPIDDKIKISHYLVEETREDTKILMDIEQGLKEVKLHKEGKIELKTLDQLLDEL